ncbi:hypothetical protein BLOT_004369 [Blomia tropicalis]|nr:hypothetical protein BLOT_004369 [Blomia tropicalis]
MDNWPDKMKALFYGPGWEPGKPRTGLLSDIPKVDPYAQIERYDCEISFWQSFYVLIHSFLVAFGFYIITDHPLVRNSPLNALYIMLYVLFALTSFGTIFDRRSIAPLVESFRCLMFFPFDSYIISSWMEQLSPPTHLNGFIHLLLDLIRLFHVASIGIWIFLWYRTCVRSNSSKADLFASMDKATLLKEDKCISACAYSNNINVINQRRPWHYAIYAVSITLSLSLMWFVFALRFDECNQIFKYQPSNNIEL